MRKSRFKDEQIVAILRETDRDAVPVVAKRHGVSEQTIYTSKKRFGSFQLDDVRRLGRVIEVLSRLVSERGAPFYRRSDNGPEFVSRALLKWTIDQGIETALIDPGKPWQNGATERFNGKFCDECLSLEWFRSRAEATVVIETWRTHYNEVRLHSSLGYLTPAEFVAKLKENDAAPVLATGRAAAVCGASVPRPVASPSREGNSKVQERPAVSS